MIPENISLQWAEALLQIGQAVTSQSPEKVRQAILDHMVSGFQGSSGSIALLKENAPELVIVAASGAAAKYVGTTCAVGDGVLGWVAEQKTPLLLNGDVSSDPRFRNLNSRSSKSTSAVCWPLLVQGQIRGSVSINRDVEKAPFNEQDVAQGGLLVNLVGLVVNNVELHLEEQRRIEELRAMTEKLRQQQRQLEREKHEQYTLLKQLQQTQRQLMQSEKMASIGQLAAGVAHEINNPVGYVNSNTASLRQYVEKIFTLLNEYEALEAKCIDKQQLNKLGELKRQLDISYIREDVSDLINESLEGLNRIKNIVQDLKDFSHIDDGEWQQVDIHVGLDKTLNIVHNELKYKADVVKEYGVLPPIECLPSQINQVFMNLLVNAAHAIERQGTITVRTGIIGTGYIKVEISDNGRGISKEHMNRIFDPFFTTKPVGKGTGLGLSLAYSIVEKHNGSVEVHSEPGQGTVFCVTLPVKQADAVKVTGS